MYDTLTKALPETVLQELRNIAEDETDLAWTYGRMVNLVYDYVVINGIQMTKLETCGFVSFMAGGVRAPTTILEYSYLVLKISHELRDRYPEFNLGIFRYASSASDPEAVLEQASTMMATTGVPPTVAKLRAEFEMLEHKAEWHMLIEEPDEQVRRATVDIWSRSEDDEHNMVLAMTNLEAVVEALRYKHPMVAIILAKAVVLIQEALQSLREDKQCEPQLQKQNK